MLVKVSLGRLNVATSHGSDFQTEAQRLAEARRQACRRPCKLDDPETHQYVREHLEQCWSSDQIAGRSRLDIARQPRRFVSRQTIYNWIDFHEIHPIYAEEMQLVREKGHEELARRP